MISKTRILIVTSLMAVVLVSGLAWGQAYTIDWSTYHRDHERNGFSPDTKENGSGIHIIWTFPRTDKVPHNVTNNVVDIPVDTDPAGWYTPKNIADTGEMLVATDYYGYSSSGDGYRWAKAYSHDWIYGNSTADPVVSPHPALREVAVWTLPANFNNGNNGYFQVQTWFPSSGAGKKNTPSARYRVTDVEGNTYLLRVDQRTGGTWTAVGQQLFHMGPGCTITVDNVMDSDRWDELSDQDQLDSIVVADAIRLVSSTGLSILGSPAAGQLELPANSGQNRAVTWFGGIEEPLASLAPGVAEGGAVYCVRSDYTTTDYTAFVDDPNSSRWNAAGQEAQDVGTALWRYPMGGLYDDRKPIGRDRVEGPIGKLGLSGGIFSSPTVMEIHDSVASKNIPAVVIGGNDGQVYCIDGASGKLMWKGPGVTLPEPLPTAAPGEMALPSAWTVEDNKDTSGTAIGRYDAFGGTFSYAVATDSSSAYDPSKSIIYYIGRKDATDPINSDPRKDAEGSNQTVGHMYAIYAWIPGKVGADVDRVTDAHYGITYYDAKKGKRVTDIVLVDQSIVQGRWVRIGGSYWNPYSVELSPQTKISPATGKVVIADAIMIVPDGTAAFSYSSAIGDEMVSSPDARLFIGNANGRIYSFIKEPGTDYLGAKATTMPWAFPKLQTANPTSDAFDAEATGWSGIVSSPALTSGADPHLIVSSYDGYVRAIQGLYLSETDPTSHVDLYWSYYSSEAVDPATGDLTSPDLGEKETFNSSPAIYGDRIYVPSTSGRLHAIEHVKAGPGKSQRAWVYPDNAKRAVPLPSFQFSTPAIFKLNGASDHRIYCGSTGGKVYGFKDLGTSGRLLSDDTTSSTGFEFKNPDFAAPIWGSVAIDGGNLGADETGYGTYQGNVFVGTLGTDTLSEDGGIYWFNRRTGFASDNGIALWEYAGYTGLGQVFSSPAVANHYAYVGVGAGRLCAFSASAFGGQWVGGGYDGRKDPPGDIAKPRDEASTTSQHVDMFTGNVYDISKKVFEVAGATGQLDSSATATNAKKLSEIIAALTGTDASNFVFKASFGDNPNTPWKGHARAFEYPHSTASADPRELYYEWGEDMYAIAWNLPPLSAGCKEWDDTKKDMVAISPLAGSPSSTGVGSDQRNAVKFRFVDSSPGYGSGGVIGSRAPEALFEYSFVARDKQGNIIYDPADATKPLIYRRSIAFCKVEMRADSSNPPAPGVGWRVNVGATTQNPGADTRGALLAVSVPQLNGSPGDWTIKGWKDEWQSGVTPLSQIKIIQQDIGINCPLALKATSTDLAWPDLLISGSSQYRPNRSDPEAHFNGNGWYSGTDPSTATWNDKIPALDLGPAQHSTNTTPAIAGLMDRSAVGLRATSKIDSNSDGIADRIFRTDAIKTLRIQTNDLHWQGGNNAVKDSGGSIMPWDYPPYYQPSGFGWETRLQRDYPDISRRELLFQKSPDNNDPTQEKTTLQPAVPKDPTATFVSYDSTDCYLRADATDSWVEVPKFQPANVRKRAGESGYRATVFAFLDTNGNGRFDGGEITEERVNSRVEPYRKFDVLLDVLPDYHMVIEKPLTIDITGQDRAPAPHGLGIGVDPTVTNEWYKSFTLRNMGNVNLHNLKIAKPWLFADNVNPFFPIKDSGAITTVGVVSSLDGWDPKWGDINGEPFLTTTSDLGYTLSKARVGEVDGTVLTIPDSRKLESWPITDDQVFAATNQTSLDRIEPSVSVRVPLSQPSGSYHGMVPIWADLNSSGTFNANTDPRTDPSFQLNVTVAEDRITGGPTPGSAVQVDATATAMYGDAQPTAWRDPLTGKIHLFWTSNRFQGLAASPVAKAEPGDPWYLMHATLPYQLPQSETAEQKRHREYNWDLATGLNSATTAGVWWETPATNAADYPFPRFAFPTSPGNVNWPVTSLPGALPNSVKYSSPYAAVVEGTADTWLFMQGQVDVKDATTGKIERQSTLLYTPATGGNVTTNVPNLIYSFVRDPHSAKLNPKAVAYRTGTGASQVENMLLTWHGGDAGRWSIFASFNASPTSSHNPNGWSQDMKLKVPSCLVSTAEPMPIHRSFELVSTSGGSATSYTSEDFFDVVYTGASKYDQSTDLILTRYQLKDPGTKASLNVVSLPRVLNEELLRDPKRNVYTSKQLAWMRPSNDGGFDKWGNTFWTYSAAAGPEPVREPFIRVVLPDPAGGTNTRTINAMEYSAADPSLVSGEVAPVPVKPVYDKATDVYTYQYRTGSVPAQYLGQMLVDFSAGIVRFTKPLPPKTKVYAEYSPQSMRITRGLEQDSAPFVFMEKTMMSKDPVTSANGMIPNPGLLGTPGPVDRMWVFWRKPSTSGVQSSSIYYKTYRVTAELRDSTGKIRALPLDKDGIPTYDQVSLNGKPINFPLEVSWDGKKVFFPASMERYPGQADYPGALATSYTDATGEVANITLDTLTWQEELPETALPTRQSINEGMVSAFADPSVLPTKIWVFWSSTRAGKSDLYYQTISPNFRALY